MENNNEVLLKVDHLCQYFRLGRKDFKAVDDVCFEIKKGESFGLVGESGCGKTTTGRSIIKLYNITSGNVYFKGQRIGAGIRSYKDAIADARAKARAAIKSLKSGVTDLGDDEKIAVDDNNSSDQKLTVEQRIAKIKEELADTVAKNRALIRSARADNSAVDKEYSKELLASLNDEYSAKINQAEGDEEKVKKLKREFKNKSRVAKKRKLITQIQMIFQDPIASLDPRMTVRDIIAEGLVINGITDKDYINEKVYEILEMVGLVREHADRYPHEFSGGQRQRIGIARAVVMQPEMIIADEPISALDVSIQAQVINLLNDLRERLGLTILFIAHDLSVVKYFSDRIGVMYFGKMVELASSDELFKNPLHPYTKSLLSAIPLPDPVYEKQRIRVTYNPIAEHDYSSDTPSFREITPGHFVYCNDAEEKKYKQTLNEAQ